MDVSVAIVGSGFSGIGLAINLRRAGVEDFAVLERGDGVGGTWHYNTYPGCACDVPSNLYSFSFAPNPELVAHLLAPARDPRLPRAWSWTSSACDRRSGSNTEVLRAAWDDDAQRWRLETSAGRVTAQGPGLRHRPAGRAEDPGLPRARELRRAEVALRALGPLARPARASGWRAIGTGASAIQYVPTIAPDVEQLYVFQRTPPWVMPHSARPITPIERRVYRRFPAVQRAVRGGIYAARELMVLGFVKQPRAMKLLERVAAPAPRARAAATRS